jgi:1-acyl-sn-glycerol-3-phosphate acyltransferase
MDYGIGLAAIAPEEAERSLLGIVSRLAGELRPERPRTQVTLLSDLEQELGIDSLGRMELRLRIEEQFGRPLGEQQAFAARTPAELLLALGATLPPGTMASVKTRTPGGSGRSDPTRALIRPEQPPRPPAAVEPWRHKVGAAAEWLHAGYTWTVFIVLALITCTLMLLTPVASWRFRIARAGARLAFVITTTPLHTAGSATLPRNEAYILVANHASYLDAFVLIAALPVPYRFIVKGELARNRLLRRIIERFGAEFVDRFDPRQAILDTERMCACVRAGHRLLFFPEGSFIETPGLQPFRMGAFVIAARSAVPVIPVVISGTRSVLRARTWRPRRGAVSVVVRPPVRPDGADWQAALRLRQTVRAEIGAYCGEPDLLGPGVQGNSFAGVRAEAAGDRE